MPLIITRSPRILAPSAPTPLDGQWRAGNIWAYRAGLSGLNLLDANTGKLLAPANSTNLSVQASPAGVGVYQSSHIGTGRWTDSTIIGADWTIVVVMHGLTVQSNYQMIVAQDNGSSERALHLRITPSPAKLELIRFNTSGSPFTVASANIPADAMAGQFVIVARSSSSGAYSVTATGVPTASDTITGTPCDIVTGTSPPVMFNSIAFDTASYYPVGTRLFTGAWKYVFTDAQVTRAIERPWQLYAPLPRRIWVPGAGGGGAYTLTAAAGSYSLTGQSAALVAARKIAAAQGAYALTGQAVGVKAGRKVAAAQGAYSLTGQAAALRASRSMAAAQGSYALTGQAAGFLRGRALLAAQGAYALTGQAAGLRAARKFAAAQGAYALNGQVAALNYSGSGSKTLLAGQGSYTLNGQALNLRAARRLPAVAGAYGLAGQAVTLTKTGVGYTLTAAQGAYAITGTAVGLRVARRMAANYGTYQLAGQVVTLSYSGVVLPPVVAMSVAPLHRRADGPGRASQLSTGRRVAPPNGYRS